MLTRNSVELTKPKLGGAGGMTTMPVLGWKLIIAPGTKLTPSIFSARLLLPDGAAAGVILVITGIAPRKHLENSEVLPFGSVAVAVTTWPAGTALAKVAVKVAVPLM